MTFKGFSLGLKNANAKRPLGKTLEELDSDPGSDNENGDPASKRARVLTPRETYLQRVPQSSKRLWAMRKSDAVIPEVHEYFQYVWVKASNMPASSTKEDMLQILRKAAPEMEILDIKPHQPTGPSNEGKIAPTLTWIIEYGKQYLTQDYNDLAAAVGKPYVGEGLYLRIDRLRQDELTFKPPKQEIHPLGARPRPPPEEFKAGVTNMHAVAPPPALVAPALAAPAQIAKPVPFDIAAVKRKTEILALRARNPNTITVFMPRDKATLQLVNMVSELVITGGLECEAALMNMPTIKKDLKFAWLYDQTHQLNHYYRWNLWRLTRKNPLPEIFDSQGEWVCPDGFPPFEFACSHQDVKGKIEIQMPDPNFYGRQLPAYILSHLPDIPKDDSWDGHDPNFGGYLNIVGRMNLMNMLRDYEINDRYFDTNHKIARITAFACAHALHGMAEIADTLIDNIFQPLHKIVELGTFEPENRLATINALYILSDVVMVSKSQGGPCVRYMEYIGAQLQQRGVFLYLKRLIKDWEAMKGVSTYDTIETIKEMLTVWGEKKVFKEDVLADFHKTFNNGR